MRLCHCHTDQLLNRARSRPTPPNRWVGPTLPLPIGSLQSQPVIRRSLGAKTGGQSPWRDREVGRLPDAQKVTQAVFTLSGVSVKELRDLCIKLPAKTSGRVTV